MLVFNRKIESIFDQIRAVSKQQNLLQWQAFDANLRPSQLSSRHLTRKIADSLSRQNADNLDKDSWYFFLFLTFFNLY